MQRLLIKRPFYLLALLSFALVVTIAWWSMRPAIFLTAGDEWHDLGHAYSGRSVVIHYRHSVQQTHVWEYLTVNDTEDGFVLRSTKYKSYDVGLPFLPNEGHFRSDGEYFYLDNMNRILPRPLTLRTGLGTELTVTLQKTYALYQRHAPGTLVTLAVTPRWRGYYEHFKHWLGGERNGRRT